MSSAVDYSSLTILQLKALLDERGISYKSNDLKQTLIDLLEEGS